MVLNLFLNVLLITMNQSLRKCIKNRQWFLRTFKTVVGSLWLSRCWWTPIIPSLHGQYLGRGRAVVQQHLEVLKFPIFSMLIGLTPSPTRYEGAVSHHLPPF